MPFGIDYVNNGTYLISVPEAYFTLTCPSSATLEYNHAYCLVTVPCACSLNTRKMTLPPSLAQCHMNSTSVEITFPKNAAQLHLFQLDQVNVTDTADREVTFSTPAGFSDIDISEYKSKEETFRIDMKNAQLVSSNKVMQLKTIHRLPATSVPGPS